MAEFHYSLCVPNIYYLSCTAPTIRKWGFWSSVAYEPFLVAIPEGSIAPALKGLTQPDRYQMGK